MSTAARGKTKVSILEGVPYKEYLRLIRVPANSHLRMAYHDGTLEIVSPRLRMHETPSARLRQIVTGVADRLGLPYQGTDSYTFRKGGDGPFQGKGKEADRSFYFGNVARLPSDRDPDLDAGDPPPDLWIEVDNRASSQGRLPIYAALGVPEVWRYRARKKTLTFLRLVDGTYEAIERSLSLPPLTPALVLEALDLGDHVIESEWAGLLRDWVARTIVPPG